MNRLFLIFSLFLLTGCGQTAYNPHYIVSDTLDEKTASQKQETESSTMP